MGAIGKENDNSGFNLIIMKPDQEPAIRALIQAVKNETGREVNIEKRVELIPVNAPVEESMGNWRGRKIYADSARTDGDMENVAGDKIPDEDQRDA